MKYLLLTVCFMKEANRPPEGFQNPCYMLKYKSAYAKKV
ncbi:hypothetical protein NIASO_14255 [Niabella soli DSM 19437]|uniref:Uncharacterized protein n=1 Tax=Niabella soli DSM 19437 TaxID=929713 RepID=W0F8K6_9BACT|nr:hypothetical protein NIASO_14255 [Niabella soli DSM 19437]